VPHADEAWSCVARPFVVTWHKEAKEACVRREIGPCDRSGDASRSIEDSPEVRELRSRENSVHRARSRVRVLAKANLLVRLLTLTFAQEHHSRQEVLERLAIFERKLRARWPRLRYLYVLELHPGGHGYHVHMGINKYTDKDALAEVWGNGFIDVLYLKSAKVGYQQGAADVARYLAKYITKCAEDVPKGKRRFSGSLNLVDTVVSASFPSLADAVAWISSKQKVFWWGYLSGEGLFCSVVGQSGGEWSDKVEGFRGPECWLFR
jgi:hypothetical protein